MSRIKSIGHRCIVLFTIYTVYIVLGGIVFSFLEYEAKKEILVDKSVADLERKRTQLLNMLWSESKIDNREEWLDKASLSLHNYEDKLKLTLDLGDSNGSSLPDGNHDNHERSVVVEEDGGQSSQWSFVGSIFYCFTVVTTIGYGNLAPATAAGRCLTIVYGAVGIPLTLILMGELGKLITLVLKSILSQINSQTDSSDEFSFGVIASVFITVPFLLVGTLIVWHFEKDWSPFEAFYFSFITYSTIGFGDLVPKNLGTTMLLMVYILMALSLCAMCFSVFQVALDDWLNKKQEAASDWWKTRQISREAAKYKKCDDIKAPVASEYCYTNEWKDNKRESEVSQKEN